MRTLALLCITLLTLMSCGDEVEFNSPAIQGNKNGNLWRAQSYAADIDFGGFLIEGRNSGETVQLVTRNDVRGTFNLGGDNANVAIFRDFNGVVYSTANAPDPSLSLYPADGQIIVEDISNTQPKTVTGTFRFNAFTEDGLRAVNFNEGVFYQVSLVGGLVAIDNGSACLQATQQASIAATAFNAIDTTAPNYTEICNAYKLALNEKINTCGDPNGEIQTTVDTLADCIP